MQSPFMYHLLFFVLSFSLSYSLEACDERTPRISQWSDSSDESGNESPKPVDPVPEVYQFTNEEIEMMMKTAVNDCAMQWKIPDDKKSESGDLKLFPYSENEQKFVDCLIIARGWNDPKTNIFDWIRFRKYLERDPTRTGRDNFHNDVSRCYNPITTPRDISLRYSDLQIYMCITSEDFNHFLTKIHLPNRKEEIQKPWLTKIRDFCNAEAHKAYVGSEEGTKGMSFENGYVLSDDLIAHGFFPRNTGEARYLSCVLITCGLLYWRSDHRMDTNERILLQQAVDLFIPNQIIGGNTTLLLDIVCKFDGLISPKGNQEDVRTLEDHYAALFQKEVFTVIAQEIGGRKREELAEVFRKREKMALERCKEAHNSGKLRNDETPEMCALQKIGYMKQDYKKDWEWFSTINRALYPSYPVEDIISQCNEMSETDNKWLWISSNIPKDETGENSLRDKWLWIILTALSSKKDETGMEKAFSCIEKQGKRKFGELPVA